MNIQLLDHVNIQTTQLEMMEQWYSDILGLEKGYRPPFKEPGSWLYGAGHAMVHLVEAVDHPDRTDRPALEHFAMRAEGLGGLVEKLKARTISHYPVRVPETRILQINFHDPEGNHLHIDFPAEEADALGYR